MLSKNIRPIPTEHFGIKDEEELLRRRYLDLMINPETRELFRNHLRSGKLSDVEIGYLGLDYLGLL